MKIEVVHALWGADDLVLERGEHIVKLSAESAPLFAGGLAAGSLLLLEASDAERSKLDRHVESQEDTEKAYAAAQADGRWQEGNLMQFAVSKVGYGTTGTDEDGDVAEILLDEEVA